MKSPTKEALKIAKMAFDKVFGKEFTIESMDWQRKRAGVRYKVVKQGNGVWKCECMSFKTHSGTEWAKIDESTGVLTIDRNWTHSDPTFQETCKHIRFCMEHENDDELKN